MGAMRIAFKISAFVIFASFLLLGGPLAAEKTPRHVLFIGNSYISANSLPLLFQEISAGAGFPKPVVGYAVPGGFTLAQHSKDAGTLAMIDRGAADGARWDAIVLQEQSVTPAFAEISPPVRQAFLGGASALAKRIREKNPAAEIVFLETWARHADLWKNSPKSVEGFGGSSIEMQRLLRKWTETAARTAAGSSKEFPIARAGDLWERNYKSEKPIRLHEPDGSHPTFAGSYLAGLALFETIYKTSPRNVRYVGTLSEADGATLKNLAAAQ
jgi:hypothetical protein